MTIELTWLGHGSWEIQLESHHVLLDPFLDDSPTSPVKADQVQADYILVSHGHFDHVADVVAIAQRTGATVVSNYEICEWLGKQGVAKCEPMNLGGGCDFPFGRVQLTLAHHSSTLPDGTPGGNPGGFVIALGSHNIYFACDTGLFYDMKLIGSGEYNGRQGIDLAVLPIGDRFTMGPVDSIRAIQLIEPHKVLPSHYGTWPPIAQDAEKWAQSVRLRTEAEPFVLAPGEKLEMGDE